MYGAGRMLKAGQKHGTTVWLEESEGEKATAKPKPSTSVQKPPSPALAACRKGCPHPGRKDYLSWSLLF